MLIIRSEAYTNQLVKDNYRICCFIHKDMNVYEKLINTSNMNVFILVDGRIQLRDEN